MSWFENRYRERQAPNLGWIDAAGLFALAWAMSWALESSEISLKTVEFFRTRFFVFTKEPFLQSYVYLMVSTFILKAGIVLLTALLLVLRREKIKEALALDTPLRKDWFRGAVFFTLFAAVIAWFEGMDPLAPNLPVQLFFSDASMIGNAVALVSVLVVAPIAEEIFFRGFLYRAFQNTFGAIFSITATAFLFALMHVPQSRGDWHVIGVIFLGGFLITLGRAFTGSTRYAIVLHLIYNGILTLGGFLNYLRYGF